MGAPQRAVSLVCVQGGGGCPAAIALFRARVMARAPLDPDQAPPPAGVRRAARQGATAVVAADWTDPDDIKPSAAHNARTVHGWRTYCPLRRMMVNAASGITAPHIHAADKLREAADLARLGYSTSYTGVVVALAAQPRAGASHAEMQRTQAQRTVTRALKLFTPEQGTMLWTIILQNQSLYTWARERNLDPKVEKGRRLTILDLLVQHFESEIEDELRRGGRLPV